MLQFVDHTSRARARRSPLPIHARACRSPPQHAYATLELDGRRRRTPVLELTGRLYHTPAL